MSRKVLITGAEGQLGRVLQQGLADYFDIIPTAKSPSKMAVKKRGVLKCVVSTGIAGFAYPDDSGKWKGFDIDFCRATAAAVVGWRRAPRATCRGASA